MIDEIYQDIATEGDYEGQVNSVHPWWVRFTDGSTRPATEQELELWQLAMGYKDNYQGACKNYWESYMAGTGKTIETFDGVDGKTPENEIRIHREKLEARIKELEKQVRSQERELESRGEYK